MKKEYKKIDSRTEYTEVYHDLMSAFEESDRLCRNAPKTMNGVVSEINTLYYEGLSSIWHASNTYDGEEKELYLSKAERAIFAQQTGLDMLLRSKSVTAAQCNLVVDKLSKTRLSIKRWLDYTIKDNKNKIEDAK